MAADAARCNPEGRANDRGQLALKQESKTRYLLVCCSGTTIAFIRSLDSSKQTSMCMYKADSAGRARALR